MSTEFLRAERQHGQEAARVANDVDSDERECDDSTKGRNVKFSCCGVTHVERHFSCRFNGIDGFDFQRETLSARRKSLEEE